MTTESKKFALRKAEQMVNEVEGTLLYLTIFGSTLYGTAREGKSDFEVASPNSESLSQHLISQIRFADIDDNIKKVACFIIGNLDHNGYLCQSEEELLDVLEALPE